MSNSTVYTKTSNGASAHDSDSCSTYAGIWMIMAKTPQSRIEELYMKAFTDCLALEESEERTNQLIRLLTLALRLRDFRNGGQGRRLESRVALLTILSYINDPNVTNIMLRLLATHHGRWDDLNDIRKHLNLEPNDFTEEFKMVTKEIIASLFVETICNENLSTETMGAWKYFPTERSADIEARIEYGRLLFPTITEDIISNGRAVNKNTSLKNRWHRLLKSVRLSLAPFRRRIPMIERELCGKTADRIIPEQVPGVALQRFQRALTNVASLKSKKGNVQRSDEPNRIKCAENFRLHAEAVLEAKRKHREEMDAKRQLLEETEDEETRNQILQEIQEAEAEFEESAPKVHGGDTVFAYQLVEQYMREGCQKENPLIEAQFSAMQDTMKELLEHNILVVPDTSGSMSGLPSYVAIAFFALFASSLPKGLRHKGISFSSRPRVFDLSDINNGNPTLLDYIKYYQSHSIVDNTNIQAVFDLVNSMLESSSYKLDMILFVSDCQFDQMVTNRSFTAGEYIKSKPRLAETLCAFWNVNGEYLESLPASPSENGIIMVSGHNQKMMENIMDIVKAASLISPEDLQKQREEASRLFALDQERLSEERRIEMERLTQERNINTYQLILDFCEGKFSYPLRRELCALDSGIFADYSFTDPDLVSDDGVPDFELPDYSFADPGFESAEDDDVSDDGVPDLVSDDIPEPWEPAEKWM